MSTLSPAQSPISGTTTTSATTTSATTTSATTTSATTPTPTPTTIATTAVAPPTSVIINQSPQRLASCASAARPPEARGPLSGYVLDRLAGLHRRMPLVDDRMRGDSRFDAVCDDDLHLALYLCQELHFSGWPAVDDRWEWDPALIRFRNHLSERFIGGLRQVLPAPTEQPTVELIERLVAEDRSPSVSTHLLENGTLSQFREFVMHRSAYQLKEADPHTFGIPRLNGDAKQALVRIQAGEYGTDHADHSMHSSLFAATMRELGLDDRPNAYVDTLPGTTLATSNLVSVFGLRRAWRGALVGHLAVLEMTSVEPMTRYAAALRRLGGSDAACRFYDVHILADAEHHGMALHDMAGALLRDEPQLAGDVIFGAQALIEVETRMAAGLLAGWSDWGSSLRRTAA